MAIIGFDQDPQGPPGMGMFHFDDGRSQYAHDPETAASLQAPPPPPQPMADPRLASNADMVDGANAMFGGNAAGGQVPPGRPQPTATDASQGGPVPGPVRMGTTTVENVQPPQPVTPPPQATTPIDQQAAIQNYVNRPIMSGPTPGGYIPKSKSEKYEQAGPEYTQEGMQMRYGLNQAVEAAKMQTLQTQADREAAQSAQIQAALPKMQADAAKQQAELQTKRDTYKRNLADLQGDVDKANAGKVDSNHFFESRNALQSIGLIIGQVLGAGAASMNHGPNFAKEMVDDQVARDVADQRQAIESNRLTANNKLKSYMDRYGMDIDEASNALTLAQKKIADNQLMQYAAVTKNQDIMNAANEWHAANQQDFANHEQELWNQSIGKRSGTVEMQYRAPSAGGGRAPTEAEKQQRIKTLQEQTNLGQSLGVISKPKDTKEIHDDVQKYGEHREAIEEARSSLKLAAEKAGIDFDPVTGRANLPEGRDIPGVGFIKGKLPDRAVSQQGRDVRQSQETALSAYIRGIAGPRGEASPELRETLRHQLVGTGDMGYVHGLENAWRELNDKERALGGTYGLQAEKEWNRQHGESVEYHNEEGAGPRVGPPIGRVR